MKRVDPPGDRDGDVLAGPRVYLPQRFHYGDTTGVERQRISSGAALEQRIGYSRAVRVGPHVWVSGTAPIMPGDADPPADAYGQARVCLEIIGRALKEAGAGLDDVVRTRIYVTSPDDVAEVGRAHAEAFGTALPACTGVVTRLFDSRWRVEIEAEAMVA